MSSPCKMAYGLKFWTELPLPGFAEWVGDPDVQIVLGATPSHLGESAVRRGRSEKTENEFLMKAPNGASFYVRSGELVVVDPGPLAPKHPEVVSLLTGPVMAAILYMRKRLVLHASGTVAGSSVVLFMGASGSGKSTTAAKMLELGHLLVTDDLGALDLSESGQTKIWPGPRLLKLRHASTGTPWLEGKNLVFNPGVRPDRTIPVRHIFHLTGRQMETDLVKKAGFGTAFGLIRQHTFRPNLLVYLTSQSRYFQLCTTVASHTPVSQLFRTTDPGAQTAFLAQLATPVA